MTYIDETGKVPPTIENIGERRREVNGRINMSNSTGKLDKKIQKMRQDMDNIVKYLTTYGSAHKDELIRHCKISPKAATNRFRKLKEAGIIRTERVGQGAVWVLGKQEQSHKCKRRPNQKKDEHHNSLQLAELPPVIQRMFGMVAGFTPPEGRHIEERMPDFTVSKTKAHIGSGSCAHIDLWAGL